MDHVKGALQPLASMVMEFPKLVECTKPSEAGRELISLELESVLKNEGEGGIGFMEIVKEHEFMWQMEINKELESPNLKRDFLSLYSKLTSLIREGDYTEDLDRSEEVKVWAEARELSYDLEDVIEKFVVYIQESRRVGRLPEIDTLKKLMQKMANLQLGENVITDEMINIAARLESTTTIKPGIQAFYTEIPGPVGLSGNMDSFVHLISDDNVAKVTSEVSEKHSGTEDMISSNDPGLVPDDYRYEDRNMPSKIKPKVACVVGFGGLGKTTLVRTYYDKIKKEYSCKAFVTVGRNADEKKVLMDILLALDKEKKEKKYIAVDLLKLDEWELTKELEEFLCKQSYLIVVDDIWKENSWEFIECAFRNEGHLGSQVFTTTRSISVAKACCSSSDGRLIYQMEPLSDEDSNSLFCNRVFSQEGGQCHDDFKQVSAAILKKCGGVPLAIITIASLLASSGEGIKPISEWNYLLKSIGSGLTEGESVQEMNKILSLSYDDLPPELKNCLLYMVVFPEDYVIKKDHLLSKWIAEDFVRRTNQEDSLFEVAGNYLNILINRSFIQAVKFDGEGKAKACRVHDMVLGFLCSLSSEANFVTIIDGSIRTTSNSETKIRRLSIQNCMATPQAFIAEHSDDMEHVRSFTLSSSNHVFDRSGQTFYKLLCEAENGHTTRMEPLSTFKVLRVLDLRDCCPWLAYHQTKPLQADCLLHLRYLGLRNTIFNILPTDVEKMKFLQILDLRNHNFIKELPSSTVELRGLIYLRVDPKTRLPGDFGKLTSLEKLTHVMVNQDSAYLAKQLGYLSKLRVLRITLENMDRNLAREFVDSLQKLQEIRTLEFRAPSEDNDVSSPGITVCVGCMEESWEPSSHLLKFSASNDYCFSVRPRWITESCNISSLSICLKDVGRDDIEILGRLQYLRYLNLTKEDKDNMYPTKPEEGFQFENDAFPVARELRITGIVMLPAMFPKGAMPKVQILEFNVRLEDFGNMNLEMAHLPALKKMKVIIWYKIDVPKVTNGAQGSFHENYTIVRNYVHEVIGAHVKDAEAALRAKADSHPNRHTTDIETRRYEHAGNLGRNKFQCLMGLLKMAEEEAAAKRIRFSDTEAFDVLVSRQQHLTESRANRFPSHRPLDVMLSLGVTPAAAFQEIMFGGRAAQNPKETNNDVGVTFTAQSHAQAVKNVIFYFELLMLMWKKDEDEVVEKRLRSGDMEAVDFEGSRQQLPLTEIGEASRFPSLPSLDSDEDNFEFLLNNKLEEEIVQEHRVVEESMATNLAEDKDRAAARKGKEKMYISSDMELVDVEASRRLTEIREFKSSSMLKNKEDEEFQRVVEVSIATKLAEDRARAAKDNVGANDFAASTSCMGKDEIIYISSNDVKGSRQPLRLTEIGEASRFPSLQSLDPYEGKFKNDEDQAMEKQLCSNDVEDVDPKAKCQPLRLTEIGEASGFPSDLALDPDDENELKYALSLSMLKNEDEEEIFQNRRVVENSMPTTLVEKRECMAKINAVANDDKALATCPRKEEIIYISSSNDIKGGVSVKTIGSPAQVDSSREVVVYGQYFQGRMSAPSCSADSLDELEQKMLSVMDSIRLAKEAIQYEIDISRQEAKDLVLKNTDLDMELAAEKTQVEQLKMRLAANEKTASENVELKTKIRELSELMKGLVETNKGLVTKLEEAKTEVKSAAQFQEKYKDLQIIRQRLEIKDIAKSKHIDHLKKEHEDLQTKYKELINSFKNLER